MIAITFGLQLPYKLKQQFPNSDAAAPHDLQALTSLIYSSLSELSAVNPNPGPESKATPRADALQSNLVTRGQKNKQLEQLRTLHLRPTEPSGS
jgi:hypothetical protein